MDFIERQADPERARHLSSQGATPLLANLLAARGIGDLRDMHRRSSDLLPVDSLKNAMAMGRGIADAVRAGKRFLVIADYDADGATSCAIMLRGLRKLGGTIDYLVPDRLVHGYGLTPSIVQEAKKRFPDTDILLTVDNGITSVAGVNEAHALGMQVFVTDHHLPGKTLPDAEIIVNPNQPGCEFASKSIAGCGVAWYVMRATAQAMGKPADMQELLPYVAVGTVADVVKLDANNRILVSEGLALIRRGAAPPGIQALITVSKKLPGALSTTDIGFSIGPRINAAGRLENMSTGIECLMADKVAAALPLAEALDEINVRRREMHLETVDQALGSIATEGHRMSVVAYDPDWHEGVVGIVAGKIREAENKPVFVMTKAESGMIKGSGRSIEGFHLKDAIDQVALRIPEAIVTYGGHAMAAGITIRPDGLEAFRDAFDAVVRETYPEGLPGQVVATDGNLSYLPGVEETRNLMRLPWGNGFPEPQFLGEFQVAGIRRMGEEKQHARLTLSLGGEDFPALWFNCPETLAEGVRIRTVYRLGTNTFRDETTVEAVIQPDVSEVLTPSVKPKP